jgi:hypothetical protein
MEWFKKHTDAVMILTAFAASILWMNGKFNEVDKRFSGLEKEIAVVKTVLIVKNIMPPDLAHASYDEHDK